MNNTNHFGLTADGRLVNLGVGANHEAIANLLADNAESVASAAGNTMSIVALLDISDLYRLKGEMTDALNSLDNDALSGPLVNFDIPVEQLTEA